MQVWIHDFRKNVWYKYNDGVVTEDARTSQAVLDELNDSGDPYYVAYVRDELKHKLVEVPQRFLAFFRTRPIASRPERFNSITYHKFRDD